MKKLFAVMLLALTLLLAACGCVEHLDRNGDGRCDKCVARMPEESEPPATTAATTTAVPITFAPDAEIAAALREALVGARLGDRLNIGLTAETAPFYAVKGESDYVRLNADGTLEIIGIRARNTVLELVGPEGRTVFRDFYAVEDTLLATSLRRALAAEGLIASAAADAPASAISRLTSLSLRALPITDDEELSAIRYMKSLTSLDLSGCRLGDLSYLLGLESLTNLDISHAVRLDTEDGGLAVATVLTGLPALRNLSIVGAYSVLNRQIFDTLVTLTANGKITLEALEGEELAPAEVDGFAATVFFSIAEYAAHLQRNGGALRPADGFSHAIFAYSAADHGRDTPITADNLALLELYGKTGYYFCSPVTTNGNLVVHLYDYSLRATREEFRAGISAGGNLTLVAYGNSSVYGGGWDSGEVTYLAPGEGVKAATVTLDTSVGTLYIVGGRGQIGHTGVTDSKSPDDVTTTKNGGVGESGAAGIFATGCVTFRATTITVSGGIGGRGGDGAAGSSQNIFFGGYNAGHGGCGGDGGAAVLCGTLDFAEGLTEDERWQILLGNLRGGAGGNGGTGGKGYLGGHDGNSGGIGNAGESVAYR